MLPVNQSLRWIGLWFLTAAPLVYGNNGQLQIYQEQLYFVTENTSYQFIDSQFTPSETNLKLLDDTTIPSAMRGFTRDKSVTKVHHGKIEENCQLTLYRLEQSYVSGMAECAFWGKMQRRRFELHADEIRLNNRPYLSLDNYRIDHRYFVSLSVGGHELARSIAYIVFSQAADPELIEAPLDCRKPISGTIFNWKNRLFCYEMLGDHWYTFEGSTRLLLPMPCNSPQQIILYNDVLWAFQRDLNRDHSEDMNICQFNLSLNKLTAHFRYIVDISESIRAFGLPQVAVNQVNAVYQEFDNGALIGYEFLLKNPLAITAETASTFLLDGHGEVDKPGEFSASIPGAIREERGRKWLTAFLIPKSSIFYRFSSDGPD